MVKSWFGSKKDRGSSRFHPVSILTVKKLQAHQSHMLVALSYGKSKRDIANYSLECEDCHEVLADWERRA